MYKITQKQIEQLKKLQEILEAKAMFFDARELRFLIEDIEREAD